jgi:hypothetical protein
METNPTQAATRAGRAVRNPSDPLSRYNFVIRCYNCPYHRVADTTLQSLPCPRLYSLLFPYTKAKFTPLLVILYIAPYLNLLLWTSMALLWICYERACWVARCNSRCVPNPLSRMILSVSVCEFFRVTNKFLRLPIEQIPATLDLARRQVGANEYMVMFYSPSFARWYQDLRLWRLHHLLHLLLSTMALLAAYLLLYPTFSLNPLFLPYLPFD